VADFFHPGWAIFIAVVTVLSLVACIVLLLVAARRRQMADDNTTGHVWDEDLRELNNPLPVWWMGLFVITVVFGAIYLALYPGLAATQGLLGWSSTGQYERERARIEQSMQPVFARYAAMSAEDLAKDPQAMEIGQRLFLNTCAQCHAADGRGSVGFPNLTDTEWAWGHAHDSIKETIANGRTGIMPPLAAAVGTGDDVRHLAHYVLSLSGSPHNTIYAQLGARHFASCAACHGADGKGIAAMGAPDLTNDIWVHGWGEAAIVRAINEGIQNEMPGQARLLTPEQIHVLAAYVMTLGQPAQATVPR
jgi:cytochrome c oxidase cbb3-type subunit 3